MYANTNKQTDGWTNGRTDGEVGRQTERGGDGLMADGRTEGGRDEWTSGERDRQIDR